MIYSIENAATELAYTFSNLPGTKIDGFWNKALMQVVKILGFDRCTLWFPDSKGTKSLYSWSCINIPLPLNIYFEERMPYIHSQILNDVKSFYIKNLSPSAIIDIKYCNIYGLSLFVGAPLLINNQKIGILGACSYDKNKTIDSQTLKHLKLFSTIFSQGRYKQQIETSSSLPLIIRSNQTEATIESGNKNQKSSQAFIVSKNCSMLKILDIASKVAKTDSTVLILGETGSGKELIAQYIHKNSKRSHLPMASINCARFSPEFLESHLFGHEKGAFTSASNRRIGLFESASNSTIFFDEIGDMPYTAQAKLLRVLQEKLFERLGSTQTLSTDARIIAATNKELAQYVNTGAFRDDLFYRLNVFPIYIPPLRERMEDIPLLANLFVEEFNSQLDKHVKGIEPGSMKKLLDYDWPGNIRELRNTIERAMILCDAQYLSFEIDSGKVSAEISDVTALKNNEILTLEEAEKLHILKALEKTQWRVSGESGAAKLLRINPQTLVSRIKRLGITRK